MKPGLIGVWALFSLLGVDFGCSDEPSKRALRDNEAGASGAKTSSAGQSGSEGGVPAGDAGSGPAGAMAGGESSVGGAASQAGGVSGGANEAGSGGVAGGSSELPADIGLRLSWLLVGADSGDSLTCEQAGGVTVHVRSTLHGQSDGLIDSFDCTDGGGTVVLQFGTYAVETTLLDGSSLPRALGEAPQLDIVLHSAPCDEVVDSRCFRAAEVTIAVDGL